MLDIEEGLAVGLQFGIVLLEELLESWDIILILPMCSDEVIALDCLHPNGLERFLEALLPSLRPLRSDALSLCRLFSDALYGASPSVSLHIMIAIDEERLRPFAVDTFVLRKDLEPSIRNRLKLWKESLVGHIASYDDTIHLEPTEAFKGMDERLGCICAAKMDVAHNADDEIRLFQFGSKLVGQTWSAEISRTRKDGRALKELSAIHNLFNVCAKVRRNKQIAKFI